MQSKIQKPRFRISSDPTGYRLASREEEAPLFFGTPVSAPAQSAPASLPRAVDVAARHAESRRQRISSSWSTAAQAPSTRWPPLLASRRTPSAAGSPISSAMAMSPRQAGARQSDRLRLPGPGHHRPGRAELARLRKVMAVMEQKGRRGEARRPEGVLGGRRG